jgi:hypothetical protein
MNTTTLWSKTLFGAHILREVHPVGCSCSYCYEFKYGRWGFIAPICKLWNSWRVLYWWKDDQLHVLRWTLPKWWWGVGAKREWRHEAGAKRRIMGAQRPPQVAVTQ